MKGCDYSELAPFVRCSTRAVHAANVTPAFAWARDAHAEG
jgi:hypothetical protein